GLLCRGRGWSPAGCAALRLGAGGEQLLRCGLGHRRGAVHGGGRGHDPVGKADPPRVRTGPGPGLSSFVGAWSSEIPLWTAQRNPCCVYTVTVSSDSSGSDGTSDLEQRGPALNLQRFLRPATPPASTLVAGKLLFSPAPCLWP